MALERMLIVFQVVGTSGRMVRSGGPLAWRVNLVEGVVLCRCHRIPWYEIPPLLEPLAVEGDPRYRNPPPTYPISEQPFLLGFQDLPRIEV
jgi:hypothetical protein